MFMTVRDWQQVFNYLCVLDCLRLKVVCKYFRHYKFTILKNRILPFTIPKLNPRQSAPHATGWVGLTLFEWLTGRSLSTIVECASFRSSNYKVGLFGFAMDIWEGIRIHHATAEDFCRRQPYTHLSIFYNFPMKMLVIYYFDDLLEGRTRIRPELANYLVTTLVGQKLVTQFGELVPSDFL